MNIVTMCRGGNVCSVACKQILSRYLGHQVIAIGAENTNDKTKKFLFDWADKIVVMSVQFLPNLKIQVYDSYKSPYAGYNTVDYTNKSILLDVGNDIWGDPFAEGLQEEIADSLNGIEYFELTNGRYIDLKEVVKTIREYKAKILNRNEKDEIV